jgi:hypothetical protein
VQKAHISDTFLAMISTPSDATIGERSPLG